MTQNPIGRKIAVTLAVGRKLVSGRRVTLIVHSRLMKLIGLILIRRKRS